MYKAKNGFTLIDATTKDGWTISNADDIMTALLSFPCFQTVYTGLLWEAVAESVNDRLVYDDIRDLADHIASNYI